MKIDLTEHLTHPVFAAIAKVATETNTKCYAIGGFVRDLLMGNESKDIDIVCLGNGIEIAKKVANHDKEDRKVTVYRNFGTAMLEYDDVKVEFVGARKESYRSESRNPTVQAGTLEDDQKRRDFTINALSISVQKEDFGMLIDPFDGFSDIQKKVIRTPLDPNTTYADDPLRMMRAIRFASQLGFFIENSSFGAIAANRERIKIVSKERITDELNKIILSVKPSVGFKLLFDTGMLQLIFPAMAKLQGVETVNGSEHKDNFYHTVQVLDNLSANTDNLWLRWAAILHDIAKPATKYFHPDAGWTFHGHEDKGARMVPGIFRDMKQPLDSKMKYVQKLVTLHLRPIALAQEEVTDSGIRRLLFEAGEDLEDLMLLCEADITSRNKEKVKRYLDNFKRVRQKLHEVEEEDRIRNWQPPVSGEQIMEVFGLKPCKEVGIIKNAIRNAILDGEIKNDGDEAYEFMLKKGREMGLHVIQENS